MTTAIRKFIDRTTMYRLVLYVLLTLFVLAVIESAAGVLPYTPQELLFTATILCASAWIINEFVAWFLSAVTNLESSLITGLILTLILPPVTFSDSSGALALAFIAAWAVGSKFVLAIGKKHVFNPAAFAVALSALVLGIPATWWVSGNFGLLPFVIAGGLAIIYKIRRFDLVLTFAAVAFVAAVLTSQDPVTGVKTLFLHSAFFFFAGVMLTEPLTMPPTRRLRFVYGALIGVLFVPAAHIGSFYFSPELALVIGNLFSFIVSPKGRHVLTLVGRKKIADGVYEFVFAPDRPFRYRPGQYLEWTLGGVKLDSRGNRRYFTIASSPEERYVRLGVRFYEAPSAFKTELASLKKGDVIHVGSLAGDFTLPHDTNRKVAFIAGGIGVTPFASMARHLVAKGLKRDAVLLYSAKNAGEVAYRDVFELAGRQGLRALYTLTDDETAVRLPDTTRGVIDAEFIARAVPDYAERTFYVSGPPAMVNAMQGALSTLGVSGRRIKRDYFPGLA